MPKIVSHTVVKNGQRWAWFALNSVLEYVDEMHICDTGSTDDTLSIIKSLKSPKIKLSRIRVVTPDDLTVVRQTMLSQTQADWLFILDADEIWPKNAILGLISEIQKHGDDYGFVVNKYYNLVGDIYHYQEEAAGNYHIAGQKGHLNIRAINAKKIPGLHYIGSHGHQGLYGSKNIVIQNRPDTPHLVYDQKYLHTTHLLRSVDLTHDSQVMKRKLKYKYELGIPFPSDFSYPEVLYLPRPTSVPSPWQRRSFAYCVNASWQTPLKYLKRRIPLFKQPVGY